MHPNTDKLAELQTRNLHNPALAALRRACSGSGREPIVEVPTARALADRESALVSYPVPCDAPTLRAMAENSRALAEEVRRDADREAHTLELRARQYESRADALELRARQ